MRLHTQRRHATFFLYRAVFSSEKGRVTLVNINRPMGFLKILMTGNYHFLECYSVKKF